MLRILASRTRAHSFLIMAIPERPRHSFTVITLGKCEGASEGCLSFDKGEELQVIAWNKMGWWWGHPRNSPSAGWFSSVLVAPKLPESVEANHAEGKSEASSLRHPFRTSVPSSSSSNATAVWPPLPPGMAPQAAPASTWPPLPPGRPPGPPPGHPPGAPPAWAIQMPREQEEDDYEQALGFRTDGRVSGRESEDRGIRQIHHYFDYSAWIADKNRQKEQERVRSREITNQPQRATKKGKPSGNSAGKGASKGASKGARKGSAGGQKMNRS